ncbi:MAG TPA: carboxylating nicotinate-nucleotide diphosphorylase, partial [Actinomycetota bacterium]|nr:carboxylating nicotinate-nucleotide diphosphorylase [Actinomycetota bacterium]
MEQIEPWQIDEMVRAFLAEDIGRGDRTTDAVIDEGALAAARIEAREPAVIAGLEVAEACFRELGNVEWHPQVRDGDAVEAGAVVARLDGSLRSILTGERTALNLLQRMSGIATAARRYVEAVAGTTATVVDTRKTTPGLRVLEKYAVRTGGASNHRAGLDDGILIKDNHIVGAGSVTEAVERARRAAPHGLKIEVEVTDLDQLDAATAAGVDAVLLDNMSPDQIRAAVARAGGKVLLEASGGITLDNIAEYARTGVDLISVGALTHSVRAVDL